MKTREELETPDVQFFFVHGSFKTATDRKLDKEPGMTLAVYQCRPESRGSIHIASSDFRDPPKIRPNFLSTKLDQDTWSPVSGCAEKSVQLRPWVRTSITR